MAEQSGEVLQPDEITTTKVDQGIITRTVSSISPDEKVGVPFEQNLVQGYDNKANPTRKPVPGPDLHTTGGNADKKA